MSTPEQIPAPQPQPTGSVVTESPNCIDYYDESIGDNTVRPVHSPDLLRIRPLQRPSTPSPDSQPGDGGSV
jgi:hypothetical protein